MHGGIHNEFPDDATQEKEKGFTGPCMFLVTFKTKNRVNSRTAAKRYASGLGYLNEETEFSVGERNIPPG
jgi:hypothetical protein